MAENYLETWRRKRAAQRKEREGRKLSAGEQFVSWIRTLLGAILIVMIVNGLAIASFVVPTGSMENTVMTGDFLFVNKFIFGPSTPQVVPILNIPLPFYKFPGIRNPRQGDVIVFIYPGHRDQIEATEFQYYLKRCIAVGGDSLVVRNKRVFVNGKEFVLPPEGVNDAGVVHVPEFEGMRTFPAGRGYTMDNYGPIRIPKKGDVLALTPENLQEWKVFIQREGHNVGYDGASILVDGKAVGSYTVQRDYVFGMGDNRDHSEDSRIWGYIPVENVVGKPIMVYWSWDTNLPISDLGEKLSSIRWSRIGRIID